jgi:hypothetical protein
MFRRNFLKLEIVRISDNLPGYDFVLAAVEALTVQTTADFFLGFLLETKSRMPGLISWQQLAGTQRCGEAVIGHRANS